MVSAVKQPDGLISVLLDTNAEFGDRDDAAMDPGEYDDPAVEEALLKVVLSQDEDEDIADRAGESLWEIWTRKGKNDPNTVALMHPAARKLFDPL